MIASLDVIDLALLGMALAGIAVALKFSASPARTPRQRVRERLMALGDAVTDIVVEDEASTLVKTRGRWWQTVANDLRHQIDTLGGRPVLAALASAVVVTAAGTLVVCQRILGLGPTLQTVCTALTSITALAILIPSLEARRRRKFLDVFPDALDYIIRSVRAGVPTGQALLLASDEVADPVSGEFRRISDNLTVGRDLKEALDEAAARVAIPDFTFFVVCLLMQRETGGPLTTTLESLATILRQRRDLRLKAQALTAEGRISAKIVGSIPFVTLAMLWLLAPSYAEVIFATADGKKALAAAGLLLAVGMVVIHRMTQLKE